MTDKRAGRRPGILNGQGRLISLVLSLFFCSPALAIDANESPPGKISTPAIPLQQQAVLTTPGQLTATIPRPAKMLRPTPAAPAKSATGDAIQFLHTQPTAERPPPLGRQHLKNNQLELARLHFEAELRRDPRQVDALLTLAAIALRQQRADDAELLYRQALSANPGHPDVLAAALNGSAAGADQKATESRLKTLLASHPASAALHFTLGNLHARQGRWHEAQQAYFNAVAVEGRNPDYLFNLAVSLDHIRQARAAAHYYQQAISATRDQPGAFDNEQAQARLRELQAEARP